MQFFPIKKNIPKNKSFWIFITYHLCDGCNCYIFKNVYQQLRGTLGHSLIIKTYSLVFKKSKPQRVVLELKC